MLDTNTCWPAPRSSMAGSSAIVMRTGAVKLMRIVSSTSSGVSRGTGMRFGIAALCTTQSR